MELNNTKPYLEARALIAEDLFREGEIKRVEMFRIGIDAALLENTGEIKYEKNTDFSEGIM